MFKLLQFKKLTICPLIILSLLSAFMYLHTQPYTSIVKKINQRFAVLLEAFQSDTNKMKLLNSHACLLENASFVIIFSYVRSGSTFLGEILNQHHNIFYTYEPLHHLYKKTLPNVRELNVSKDKIVMVSTILQNHMFCQISKLSMEQFNDFKSFRSKGSHWKQLGDCLKDSNAGENCTYIMENICKQLPYRAVKLVRATMEELLYFLESNQQCQHQIKVIHLLRDPRGKINSVKKHRNSRYFKNIANLCDRQMKDIEIRRKLEYKYTNMFMELLYEDIALKPVSVTHLLYQFVYSESVSSSVKNWILLKTNNTGVHEKAYNIERQNSSATALAWKHELNHDLLLSIQEKCKQLLSYLHLSPVQIGNDIQM